MYSKFQKDVDLLGKFALMRITKKYLKEIGFKRISKNYYLMGNLEINFNDNPHLENVTLIEFKESPEEGKFTLINHLGVKNQAELIKLIESIDRKS